MIEQEPATPASEDGDERSDLEQVVQARADAVARGEGGTQRPDGIGGESGASGVVKNQEGLDQ